MTTASPLDTTGNSICARNSDSSSNSRCPCQQCFSIPNPPLGYWPKQPLPAEAIPCKVELRLLCHVDENTDEQTVEREALFAKTHRLGNVALSLHQYIQHVAGWALKCHEMRRWFRNTLLLHHYERHNNNNDDYDDYDDTTATTATDMNYHESQREINRWDTWSTHVHRSLETLSWHQRHLEVSLRAHMTLVHQLRDRLQRQYDDMLRERQRWVNRREGAQRFQQHHNRPAARLDQQPQQDDDDDDDGSATNDKNNNNDGDQNTAQQDTEQSVQDEKPSYSSSCPDG